MIGPNANRVGLQEELMEMKAEYSLMLDSDDPSILTPMEERIHEIENFLSTTPKQIVGTTPKQIVGTTPKQIVGANPYKDLQQELFKDARNPKSVLKIDDGQVLKVFIFAGKSIFSMKNGKTNNHMTYRVKRVENKDVWHISVRSGGNERKWKYFGTCFKNRSQYTFKFNSNRSVLIRSSQEVRCFEWLLNNLNNNPQKLVETVEFYSEARCGRCRRELTDPESIKRMLGPECSGKR